MGTEQEEAAERARFMFALRNELFVNISQGETETFIN
jgi:hypothetical protein